MLAQMGQTDRLIRVCFVSPKAYPLLRPGIEGVFGGAEVDLYYLGTELARDAGFDVSFVVADYGQPAEEVIDGIRIIRSLNFRHNAICGAISIWRALGRADADIYVIKTASPGVPLVASFCRSRRRAFVYRTAHQDECDGTYLRKHPLLGRVFLRALRRADAVFAQNDADADNLKRTAGVNSTVIPNGHPMPPLPDAQTRDRILWVGRSAGFKHPERLLDLAARFPNEKFTMICQQATGDDDYESLCRSAEGRPNVEFHRRVPFAQTDTFFRRARALVNTSDSEGFSNAFIQACVWAVPILSFAVNPDEFLSRHSCGLCCLGDMDRLAAGLRFMLDGDRYIELGRNARRYAETHHNIRTIVGEYKTVFAALAARKSAK